MLLKVVTRQIKAGLSRSSLVVEDVGLCLPNSQTNLVEEDEGISQKQKHSTWTITGIRLLYLRAPRVFTTNICLWAPTLVI